jgi:hypothetical protein
VAGPQLCSYLTWQVDDNGFTVRMLGGKLPVL